MKTALIVGSLLAACASPESDADVTGGGGKADGVGQFTPKFCGVNILESPGPVFVGEVCFGHVRDRDALDAVRVTYTDDKTELYGVDDIKVIDRDSRRVTVSRPDGTPHELVLLLKEDIPTGIAGTTDRDLSFVTPLAAWTAVPKVTCYLHRRATVPGGEKRVQSTISMGSEEAITNGNSLDAFEGAYSFALFKNEGDTIELEVLFQENRHVQDETGSFTCSTEGLVAPVSFCKEPVHVDANLGTGIDEESSVHAFNFWCRLF